MSKKPSKIFFGWWMNIVSAFTSGLPTGFYMQGIGVLFKPIAAEFGLTRAAGSMAAGVGALANGIAYPITGWLSDKYGVRWVILLGTLAMGLGMVWMNFIHSPFEYFLVWGVLLGVVQTVGVSIAHDKLVTDWFVKKRGLAMGLRFALYGSMGVIVLPIMSWQLNFQSWRTVCLVWGGVTLATLPLLFVFIKGRRPEYYGMLPDGASVEPGSSSDVHSMIAKGKEYAATVQETELSMGQILKQSSYWILTLGWVLHGMLFRAINVHCVPFLTDNGVSPVIAGSMMALTVFFAIPARFIGGFIADHVRRDHLKYLLGATFVFVASGITAFLIRQTTFMMYVALIAYGFGNGAYNPVDIALRGRFFGRKAYGSNQGVSALIGAPFSLLAPIAVGWIYDIFHNYITAFGLLAGLALFGALMMLLLRPPVPQDQNGMKQVECETQISEGAV